MGLVNAFVGDVFLLTVDEAVEAFRLALVALTPIADREGLSWANETMHDDWEEIAESLFGVLVEKPLWTSTDTSWNAYRLPRYDFNFPTYEPYSWIEVDEEPVDGVVRVLIRFLSTDEPFDTPILVSVDARSGASMKDPDPTWLPQQLAFRLRLRNASGDSRIVRQLELID